MLQDLFLHLLPTDISQSEGQAVQGISSPFYQALADYVFSVFLDDINDVECDPASQALMLSAVH